MEEKILLLGLITGAIVIAKVTMDEDKNLLATQPAALTARQNPNNPGEVGMGLVDFLPFADDGEKKVHLNMQHVLYFHEPAQELLNHYNRLFGAGIVIANQLPPPPPGGRLRSI